jgi:hypothetical protein
MSQLTWGEKLPNGCQEVSYSHTWGSSHHWVCRNERGIPVAASEEDARAWPVREEELDGGYTRRDTTPGS